MEFESQFPEEESSRWQYMRDMVSWLRVIIKDKDEELARVRYDLLNISQRVDKHDLLIKECALPTTQNSAMRTEQAIAKPMQDVQSSYPIYENDSTDSTPNLLSDLKARLNESRDLLLESQLSGAPKLKTTKKNLNIKITYLVPRPPNEVSTNKKDPEITLPTDSRLYLSIPAKGKVATGKGGSEKTTTNMNVANQMTETETGALKDSASGEMDSRTPEKLDLLANSRIQFPDITGDVYETSAPIDHLVTRLDIESVWAEIDHRLTSKLASLDLERAPSGDEMAESFSLSPTDVEWFKSKLVQRIDMLEDQLENVRANYENQLTCMQQKMVDETSDKISRLGIHLTTMMESLKYSFQEALGRQEDVTYGIVKHFEERLTSAENDAYALTFQHQHLEDNMAAARVELKRMVNARDNDLKESVEEQLERHEHNIERRVNQSAAKTASDVSRLNDTLDWHEECCREMLKSFETGMARSEKKLDARIAATVVELDSLVARLPLGASSTDEEVMLLLEKRVTCNIEHHLEDVIVCLVERSMLDERSEMLRWLEDQLSQSQLWTLAKHDLDDTHYELQTTMRSEMNRSESRLIVKMEAGLGDVAVELANHRVTLASELANQRVTLEERCQALDTRNAAARSAIIGKVDTLGDTIRGLFRKRDAEMESLRVERDELIDEYYRVVDSVNSIRVEGRSVDERINSFQATVEQQMSRMRDGVNSIGDRIKNYHAKLMILDDSVDARGRAVDRRLKSIEDACKNLADDLTHLKSVELNQLQAQFESIHCNSYVLENKIDTLGVGVRKMEESCSETLRSEVDGVRLKMTAILDEQMGVIIDKLKAVESDVEDNKRASSKCSTTRKKLKSLYKTVNAMDQKMESRFQSVEAKVVAISPKEKQKSKHKK